MGPLVVAAINNGAEFQAQFQYHMLDRRIGQV